MTPVFLSVQRRQRESTDVVTITLPAKEIGQDGLGFAPGQFNMLYAFGVGEVAISVSGDPADDERIVHTLRAVGPVTRALFALKRGEQVGLRGPFGSSWPVSEAAGRDVILLAGGIGLAPLRPVLYHLLANREQYGQVVVLYGARSPGELLFTRELETWRRIPRLQLKVTVDRGDAAWIGDVGVVTTLLSRVSFDAAEAIAMLCGPEVMMRFAIAALEHAGVETSRIFVSMERNMKCAIGLCGHCQYGASFVCKDGPVFRFSDIEERFLVREL